MTCKHLNRFVDVKCCLEEVHGDLHEYYYPYSEGEVLLWETGDFYDRIDDGNGKMIKEVER